MPTRQRWQAFLRSRQHCTLSPRCLQHSHPQRLPDRADHMGVVQYPCTHLLITTGRQPSWVHWIFFVGRMKRQRCNPVVSMNEVTLWSGPANTLSQAKAPGAGNRYADGITSAMPAHMAYRGVCRVDNSVFTLSPHCLWHGYPQRLPDRMHMSPYALRPLTEASLKGLLGLFVGSMRSQWCNPVVSTNGVTVCLGPAYALHR